MKQPKICFGQNRIEATGTMDAFFHAADSFVVELTGLVLLVITAYQLIKHKLK